MKRLRPPKATRAYRSLWRVVDGAIADALGQHPDYLTAKGQRFDTARRSIAKRVTGAVLGFAEQSARGRSGEKPAAECATALAHAVHAIAARGDRVGGCLPRVPAHD